MSRRPLSNIDIEEALRLVIGIPDNDSSEDDLESLDGEEYNDETLRLVLEDETDSHSINLPPSQEVNPSIYDDPIPSSSSIQQNPIQEQEIQESISDDEYTCITNACILYSQTTRATKLSHLEFRVAVARGLIAGFSTRKRKSDALSKATYKTIKKSAEPNRQKVGDHMPVDSTYRRCKHCHRS
ncbi:hypothetical protein HF086_013606 [Spodoptera exigua]|uniref:Uncharacterized protein n=1 Tax=Spodoptera exigua TaxID=7107 RepID=A0A922M7Y4_SPOEX|nr:hypothetical protein HF086_013606 [Spodoptera exigua]